MFSCTYQVSSKFFCILQDRVPFAVVGSNTVTETSGKRVRGRQYPWGIVEGNMLYVLTNFIQVFVSLTG